VGGFEPPFGNFQDNLLAAKLKDQGHALGYAERACVRHHYARRLHDTVEQNERYALGECSYRLRHAQAECDRRFGVAAEWRDFLLNAPADRQRICRTLTRQWWRRGFWRLDLPLLRAMLRATRARQGPRLRAAAWSMRLAWLRCHLWQFQSGLARRALKDMCARTIRLGRLRFLAEHGAQVRRLHAQDASIDGTGCWSMAEVPDSALVGFHECETHGLEPFRWSQPVAALRLRLPPARYQVEVLVALPYRFRWAGIRAFFNDAARPVSLADGRIALSLLPEQFRQDTPQLLILTCNRKWPWFRRDRRSLGLAISKLRVSAA
jgi:hypothetical protein